MIQRRRRQRYDTRQEESRDREGETVDDVRLLPNYLQIESNLGIVVLDMPFKVLLRRLKSSISQSISSLL
jgi:hypothetical protein